MGSYNGYNTTLMAKGRYKYEERDEYMTNLGVCKPFRQCKMT